MLIASVLAGDLESMRSALQAGVSIEEQDADGYTALCWAAANGNLQAVDELVSLGADVFHATRDGRTAYLIALGAGKVDVAHRLEAAEAERGGDNGLGSSRSSESRPYCRAYSIEELRTFPEWSDRSTGSLPSDQFEEFTAGTIVFLQRDFTVTRSLWAHESIIWDRVTPAWRSFCATDLGFRVPSDFDLMLEG